MAISSVKPYTMSLRKFYDEESKSIFIPSIQREFVWDADQAKELVESILNNYPIGSIILWETKEPVPSSKLYDSRSGSLRGENDRKYVIDGQQRLTSLILLKNHWNITRDGKPIKLESIGYIPETKSFKISNRGIDLSTIVNATLADPEALKKLQVEYPKEFQEAIQNIGGRILSYEIPFYIIKTDTESDSDIYERIADIFTRVNSAGTQIGNLEMFLSFFAATFSKGQKELIMNFHDELNRKHGIDLEPIIRFIFSELGMSQYQITRVKSFKTALQDLKKEYEKNAGALNNLLRGYFSASKIVMELLGTELGFTSTRYLPSQNIIVPLFDFVYRGKFKDLSDLKRPQRTKMIDWFLTGSFHGLYSGSPTSKLAKDLKFTSNSKGVFPYDELIRNMRGAINVSKIRKEDLKDGMANNVYRDKSYLMILFALLHNKKATNWAGQLINFDNVTIQHIFPKEYLIDNSIEQQEKINSLGNLTFIDQSVNSSIGNTAPEDYLKKYDPMVLSSHLIPQDRSLWKVSNYYRFLKARFTLIWDEFNKFQS